MGFTADGIEDGILRFVAAEVAEKPEGLTREERLVVTGRVDSLGLLQILCFVEQRWKVNLLATGTLRDLESVAAMAEAIRREQAAQPSLEEAAS